MASWVRTSELKKIIPNSLTITDVEKLTGVPKRRIWMIRAERTEFTDYYLADRICVGLDRISDFQLLEEINNRPHHRKHGIQAYNRENCRCEVCKEAKRLCDYRYRKKRARSSESIGDCKLRT